MNTIKCLVVDDEPFALQQLASYVSKVPFLKLVDQCLSADAARKVIDSENVDAMFVDINMPDLNGLDFVRSLAARHSWSSPRPTRSMPLTAFGSMPSTICSSPSAWMSLTMPR